MHVLSQAVEVQRVLRWLFVSPMTPGAAIYTLAPS